MTYTPLNVNDDELDDELEQAFNDDDEYHNHNHSRSDSSSHSNSNVLFDSDPDYADKPPPGSPPLHPNIIKRTNAPSEAYSNSNSNSNTVIGAGIRNDGVFANMAAKPQNSKLIPIQNPDGSGVDYVREESNDKEEAPPAYNIAALDATPPYWDTTVITPPSLDTDDLIIDGLPVGLFFSFAWNLLISTSFHFVGFLLTYLLHTTHAARHGSRAGLGITFIQYGFYLRAKPTDIPPADGQDNANNDNSNPSPSGLFGPAFGLPFGMPMNETDPNLNNNNVAPNPDDQQPQQDQFPPIDLDTLNTANDWLSFLLMALGWFIFIISILSYWRVSRWARSVRRSQREANSNFNVTPMNESYPGENAESQNQSYETNNIDENGENNDNYSRRMRAWNRFTDALVWPFERIQSAATSGLYSVAQRSRGRYERTSHNDQDA